MSETKWTPGPWINDHGLRVYAETPQGFALIVSTKHTDAQSGDAALISAAPDLYAALEEVLRHAAFPPQEMQADPEEPFPAHPAVIAARAALSKARGE